MTKPVLTPTRLRAGTWEGVLRMPPAARPDIRVTLLDREIDGVVIQPLDGQPDHFAVRVPVPPEAISDGVQTFLVTDRTSDERLAQFAIVAGTVLEEDIRAEIDLLRAELDMLKKAFRRHCLETM